MSGSLRTGEGCASLMAVLQQGFSLSPVVDSHRQSKHDLPRSLGLKARGQKRVVIMMKSYVLLSPQKTHTNKILHIIRGVPDPRLHSLSLDCPAVG